MRLIVFAIFCLLISGLAHADYDADLAAMKKGMPAKVKKFIDRQVECNHWGGEEPYDEERLQEINAAADRLKCNDLEKDEKQLKKTYKSRAGVISSINKAKEFY